MMISGFVVKEVVCGTTSSLRKLSVHCEASLTSIPEKNGCIFAMTQSTAAANDGDQLDPRSLSSDLLRRQLPCANRDLLPQIHGSDICANIIDQGNQLRLSLILSE